MTDVHLITLGQIVGGFVLGIMGFYLLLKNRVEVAKEKGDHLVLRFPILGEIRTKLRTKYPGIFIDDWEDFRQKREALGQLLEPDIMLRYAKEYGINYVGLEGDREDETWSEGKLAYATLTRGYRQGYNVWGYNVFLNPQLDTLEVSRRLSQQLGEDIHPSEVQTLLFLHEIGHTPKADNQCYFAAMVNHSLSGGRRSAGMRRELKELKSEIEKHADQFALQELKTLRPGHR